VVENVNFRVTNLFAPVTRATNSVETILCVALCRSEVEDELGRAQGVLANF
jgi:hypothetical protein